MTREVKLYSKPAWRSILRHSNWTCRGFRFRPKFERCRSVPYGQPIARFAWHCTYIHEWRDFYCIEHGKYFLCPGVILVVSYVSIFDICLDCERALKCSFRDLKIKMLAFWQSELVLYELLWKRVYNSIILSTACNVERQLV